MLILRILVILLGLSFLLPGVAGVFRPERLAEALALAPEAPAGFTTIRTLIGAPYLAMAVMTVLAAVRRQGAWLVRIAATEGFMLVTRIFTGTMVGFDRQTMILITLEVVAVVILALGAILPARAKP